jgi:hypothetical protein
MKFCKSCGNLDLEVIFDAGLQPISSRYLKSQKEKERLYSLKLCQCLSCGFIQLMEPVPLQDLELIYEWVHYNEPEGHLDDVVKKLSLLNGINLESSILGLSYKEDTTLNRFNNLGFAKTGSLPIPKKILRNSNTPGVEIVQDYLSSKSSSLDQTNRKYDIILARHILEHTYDSKSFLDSLKKLAHKQTYFIFEVPDCSLVFSSCDYTAIWEDHTIYFTPSTFKTFIKNSGFSIIDYLLYPYPYENCLVIIASMSNEEKETKSPKDFDANRKLMLNYGESFEKNKIRVREKLLQIKENFGDIAIFGAGHLATMYINVFDISDLISFVLDDDQNKRGLFLPGSKLPIYGSSALLEENIKYCLTSLNPESEKKVIASNKKFTSEGGTFSSIFPSSPNSFMSFSEK